MERPAQLTASAAIELRTLTDGGQTALEIAHEVAAFLEPAQRSLDIALYDVRLDGREGDAVRDAILGASERGVAVRLLYNLDHANPIPVPPPPETVPDLLEALPVPTKPVSGIPDLMHHKYAIRDDEAVFTGSTNWTEDSWTRQENVIVRIASPELAHAYSLDFDELWQRPDVERSGHVEPRPVRVDEIEIRPWFTPTYGEAVSHRIAKHLGRARRRIRIASPVLSSGPILATLAEIAGEKRCDVAGVVDATQVDEVFRQWHTNGVSAWKVPLLANVLEHAAFAGKRSTPWGPGTVHDFMHAKVVVADDVAFVGSFNLSRSGERNAENVLEVHDVDIADRLARFVDAVRGIYPPMAVPILA